MAQAPDPTIANKSKFPQENSLQEPHKVRGEIPRYKVDLDAKPSERWTEIVKDYKQHFKQIEGVITELIERELGKNGLIAKNIVNSMVWLLTQCGAVYYNQELKAIAKQSGMPLGLLTIMQLIYEACANCTSIICFDENKKPIHIRTMDWGMDFLRALTIEIVFYKNKKPLCIATSWAGYVGILTGMRYNSFAISVNYRITAHGFWENIKKAVKASWPIGFLVRKILCTQDDDNDGDDVNCKFTYQWAKKELQNSVLISPVYFTVSGVKTNEGCIITRDRDKDTNFMSLEYRNFVSKNNNQNKNKNKHKRKQNANANVNTDTNPNSDDAKNNNDNDSKENGGIKREYLVQCNMDHWSNDPEDDIMDSKLRRNVAFRRLKNINYKVSHGKDSQLWDLLNQDPIWNDITVYGTLMSASQSYYETRLPINDHKSKFGYGFERKFKDNDITGNIVSSGDKGKKGDILESEMSTCRNCYAKYFAALNAKGECCHSGEYHSSMDDCDKMKCAMGLGIMNIGKCHWSCCYQLDVISKCPKSGKHVPK